MGSVIQGMRHKFMLLSSCFIEWDFVAVIANDTPADRNASYLVFHPNPRIVPYIFILYCVILKPTLQCLFHLTMELSVIQFFPPHEQSDSKWGEGKWWDTGCLQWPHLLWPYCLITINSPVQVYRPGVMHHLSLLILWTATVWKPMLWRLNWIKSW